MNGARKATVLLAGLACLQGLAPRAAAQAPEPLDEQQIRLAVTKGINYLWSHFNESTCWESTAAPIRDAQNLPDNENFINYGGKTALCTYALLASGVSYQEDRMAVAIRWLSTHDMIGTYAMGFRANVWPFLPGEKYRRYLQADVDTIMRSVQVNSATPGAYGYYCRGIEPFGPEAAVWDNSNSQIAALGVWAGYLNDLEFARRAQYWRLVERHWLATQCADGGWDYMGPSPAGYGSMTAGGVATLYMTMDIFSVNRFANVGENTQPPPIKAGLDWFARNYRIDVNPNFKDPNWEAAYYYYLFALERMGLASGYKFFGPHDWYREGVEELLKRQQADGGFGDSVHTAFALLFLSRGRHPVLLNQLEYDGFWQNRPRALANLTRWISRTFEREVNWQIVPLGSPPSQWHDAPILYISGSADPKFSPEQVERLRRFVLQGGMIVSVTEGNAQPFTDAMTGYYRQMFPQYPLKVLPKDHPLRTRQVHFDIARTFDMMGMDNGIRMLALHISNDFPRVWQLNETVTGRADFEQAANIYFYATDLDLSTLRERGLGGWPEPATVVPVGQVKLARLKYAGNWDPEPLGWQRFATLLHNRQMVQLDYAPVNVADLRATDYRVAHLTGTGALNLSEAEKSAIRRFCSEGGTLIIDAGGGNADFRASAEALLDELFGREARQILPPDSPLYVQGAISIDHVYYRRATRLRLGNIHTPHLQGVTVNGRVACFYSPEDLSAGLVGYSFYNLDGYQPSTLFDRDSPYQIMRNIVLWAGLERSASLPSSSPSTGE